MCVRVYRTSAFTADIVLYILTSLDVPLILLLNVLILKGLKAPEIPTIFIENGVILSIEGTDLGYEAKSIKKDTTPEAEMMLPKDARKVTDDEAAEMRKKRMGAMGWGNR